jgi:hypothetical protein
MRRMIIGAMLIAVVSTSLLAQRGQRGIPIEKMKESLELTDAQVQKLEAIKVESREQMEALRAKEFEDIEARRAAMMDIRTATKQKVEAVLTDSQQEKMQSMQAQREERMKERHKDRMRDRKEVSKERKEKMKARHKEAKAYKTEHVHPVMLEQRAKLDEKISKRDKKKIAALRTHFKMEKEQHVVKMKAAKKEGKKLDMEEMKAMKEAHKNSTEVAEAMKLAEKYADDIQLLLEEIEPQREKWNSDLKEIMKPEKFDRPERANRGERGETGKKGERGERAKRSDERRKDMHQHHHAKRHHRDTLNPEERKALKEERKEQRQLHRQMRFLLMDPNAQNGTSGEMQKSSLIHDMTVYPNPASNDANISFELVKDSKTRIELRDESGNLVKTLKDQNYDSGKVSKRMDLSDIQTGVYYIVIIAEDGSKQSSQIIVNK